MPTNDHDEQAQSPTRSADLRDPELEKLTNRLMRESRRSAILGFIGGVIVVVGLGATFYAAQQSRSSLKSQIVKSESLQAEVNTKSAEVSVAKQQAASARTVLNTTVQDLQSKSPEVSASATAAVDQAFAADPNAARLIVRVYIHISSPAQRAHATLIAQRLSQVFFVPGIDVQPQHYKVTEVHYYNNDKESIADAKDIAQLVSETGIPVITRQVPPYKGKIRPRAYGLWLAADLK